MVEQSDVEDSDADSEDSNVEGFYAHDYPGTCCLPAWAPPALLPSPAPAACLPAAFAVLGPGLPAVEHPPLAQALLDPCPLPAEEVSELDSSDDEGYDPEGATFHRPGRRREDDDASFGYGSGADDW